MAQLGPKPSTVQRARLFGIETARDLVLLSAAMNIEVIARYVGRKNVEVAPDLLVFAFDSKTVARVTAGGGWPPVLTKSVGFELLAIAPIEWTGPTVLAALQKFSPTVELLPND